MGIRHDFQTSVHFAQSMDRVAWGLRRGRHRHRAWTFEIGRSDAAPIACSMKWSEPLRATPYATEALAPKDAGSVVAARLTSAIRRHP
jgi:hypothetical protein